MELTFNELHMGLTGDDDEDLHNLSKLVNDNPHELYPLLEAIRLVGDVIDEVNSKL